MTLPFLDRDAQDQAGPFPRCPGGAPFS